MTTDNKSPDCSGCKWYNGDHIKLCHHPAVEQAWTYYARGPHGDCGLSADYYEPKEQP